MVSGKLAESIISEVAHAQKEELVGAARVYRSQERQPCLLRKQAKVASIRRSKRRLALCTRRRLRPKVAQGRGNRRGTSHTEWRRRAEGDRRCVRQVAGAAAVAAHARRLRAAAWTDGGARPCQPMASQCSLPVSITSKLAIKVAQGRGNRRGTSHTQDGGGEHRAEGDQRCVRQVAGSGRCRPRPKVEGSCMDRWRGEAMSTYGEPVQPAAVSITSKLASKVAQGRGNRRGTSHTEWRRRASRRRGSAMRAPSSRRRPLQPTPKG